MTQKNISLETFDGELIILLSHAIAWADSQKDVEIIDMVFYKSTDDEFWNLSIYYSEK